MDEAQTAFWTQKADRNQPENDGNARLKPVSKRNERGKATTMAKTEQNQPVTIIHE